MAKGGDSRTSPNDGGDHSDVGWQHWLLKWQSQLPDVSPPAPGEGDGHPPTDTTPQPPQRPRGLLVAAIAVLAVLGVVGGVFVTRLLTSNTAPPVASSSSVVEPSLTLLAPPSPEPEPVGCVEVSESGKTVTNHGGEVTSPETLIAEFQHRYFDLRDGEAVAQLWDKGYEAQGFQDTINASFAGQPDKLQWCVTVMPANTGWWATEVSWWAEGDTHPRETWYAQYRIEQRGSRFIFTDSNAGKS